MDGAGSVEERLASIEHELESSVRGRLASLEQFRIDFFKRLDTLNTPVWRRFLFRIDGWGPWHIVSQHPRWRPWRRWWTS